MSDSDIHAREARLTPGPLPLTEAKKQADRIEALLADHQRNGGRDMTVREVCKMYLAKYEEQIFPNHAEGRLANLEASGRVVCDRDGGRRPCRVTGVLVKVYSVPAKQVSLL